MATVRITPGSDTLTALGDTRQLEAVAVDAGGNPISGIDFDWSSGDASVVSVDASGLISAKGNGSTEITATASGSGVSGAAEMAVIQRVDAVTVSPGTATLTTVGATQQFMASAVDANANAVDGAQIVWASEDHSVATVDPGGLVTAKGSGSSTITATAQDIPGYADLTVNQEIASLAFRTEPSSAVAGESIDPAVQVEVLDGGGAVVEDADLTISLSLDDPQQGGASLGGSATVQAVSGVATFSGLWVDRVGSGYTLTAATSGSVPNAASSAFDVTVGPAAQVAFTTEPSSTTAGTAIGPVEVRIQDRYGNTVASATDPVDVELATNPGADTLQGTLEVSATNGVATFDDLVLEAAASGYRLRAGVDGLDVQVSDAFQVFPAAASRLAFSTQPSDEEGQEPFDPIVAVAIQDDFGNVVRSAADPLSLQLGSGPTGADLAGTLTANPANGVAAFPDISVDLPGDGYTLEAYASGFTTVESEPFSVRLTFEKISSGADHSCGITTPGHTYCWGHNSAGQLGDGNTTDSSTPVAVYGGLKFFQISAGGSRTCGILRAIVSRLMCWGSLVGDGSGSGSLLPVEVADPASGPVDWAQVSAGDLHTCAIGSSGTAYCWGRDDSGELGTGTGSPSSIPVQVNTSASFSSVSAGSGHTCGVTTSGGLQCWGDNTFGQLGDGTQTDRLSPVAVNDPAGLSSVTWNAVTAGSGHTCGFANTGSGTADYPVCWGRNDSGEVGDGTTTTRTTPVVVGIGVPLAELTAGFNFNCGITGAAQANCWGANGSGQLGDGTTTDRTNPVPVFTNLSFQSISAGRSHVCGLTPSDGVYCWGSNGFGELGDGTTADRRSPARVVQ